MANVICNAVDCIHWRDEGCEMEEVEIDWNYVTDTRPSCEEFEEEDNA